MPGHYEPSRWRACEGRATRVTISASATAGAAPLAVTFEAQGDAASYHWQLGNGETAEGPTASGD
jgi:PKD repeat protein